MMTALEGLFQAIVNGEWNETKELTRIALESGSSPQNIIINTLQPAMEEVGIRYSSGEYFLPNMLMATRGMNASMDILEPLLVGDSETIVGRIVIGTVHGDFHDIGKNIVIAFLKGVGYEVFDLGTNVDAETFVQVAKSKSADIVGLSALLTTTMPYFRTVISTLEDTGVRSRVKVIVGGAPVTSRYADEIGADGYAKDGGEAISVCKRLIYK